MWVCQTETKNKSIFDKMKSKSAKLFSKDIDLENDIRHRLAVCSAIEKGNDDVVSVLV